jgi:hypothetical protein
MSDLETTITEGSKTNKKLLFLKVAQIISFTFLSLLHASSCKVRRWALDFGRLNDHARESRSIAASNNSNLGQASSYTIMLHSIILLFVWIFWSKMPFCVSVFFFFMPSSLSFPRWHRSSAGISTTETGQFFGVMRRQIVNFVENLKFRHCLSGLRIFILQLYTKHHYAS